MKHFLLPLLLISAKLFAQDPIIQWSGSFGNFGYDHSQSLKTDSNGNVLVTGGFAVSADFDLTSGSSILYAGSGTDAYVAKYGPTGTLRWAVNFGGSNDCYGMDIATDGLGNVYSTGALHGSADFNPGAGTFNLSGTGLYFDLYISKLNADGGFVWAKKFAGNCVKESTGFTVDAAGNTYITGFFNGTVTFAPGVTLTPYGTPSANRYDIFIAKLDPSGNLSWVKQIGSEGSISQRGESLRIDASGNIVICGEYHVTTDFDPGVGEHILTPPSAAMAIFVLKLDNDGNFVWVDSMGGASSNSGYGLAIDAQRNLYVTGSFYDLVDFDPGPNTHYMDGGLTTGYHPFLLKLDSDGHFVWSKDLGGNGNGYDITVTADNNLYLAGDFNNTCDFSGGAGTAIHTPQPAGQGDAFIAKYDTDGNFGWVKCMGGSQNDVLRSIATDASGNLFAIGDFYGNATVNTSGDVFNVVSAGSQDVFLMRIGMGALATQHFEKNDFTLSPNPARDYIQIRNLTHSPISQITVTDLAGKTVLQQDGNLETIAVGSLPSGVYIANLIQDGKTIATQKIIVD